MNWQKTIEKLIERGYTQPKIAKECGCAQATISDLATGKTASPRFELGARILALVGGLPPQIPEGDGVVAEKRGV